MGTFSFDPRVFIYPPYVRCPQCGKKTFGVNSIGVYVYSRRCKNCLYPKRGESSATFPLTPLNKKVLYLDQLAISNMMKIINPKTKAFKKKNVPEYWLSIFKKIDRLCKLQLIICPDSWFHEDESLLTPDFEDLREMYRHLSNGLSFRNPTQLKSNQLCEHARNWVKGTFKEEVDLAAKNAIDGEINSWFTHLRVDVKVQRDVPWLEDTKERSELMGKELVKIFKRWQREKNKTFDDWFNEESMIVGEVIIRGFAQRTANFFMKLQNPEALEVNDFFRSEEQILINALYNTFLKCGIPESKIVKKLRQYLKSETLKDVPFIKIFATLCASLANEAAHGGRVKKPSRGMYTDITMISVLLPYCDAIFIDTECHGLINKIPTRYKFDYGTKIFSPSNKVDFLNYLDEIEAKASAEHIKKVKEVYGTAWLEPSTSLFTWRDANAKEEEKN